MKKLYLIGGAMGVGKTAAARKLKSLLPKSVLLDGDWCWDMHPFIVTDETKIMVMDNITHMLSNFLRCSEIEHVIFCWVMHEQAIIDDILSKLPLNHVQVIPISLVCSPQTLTTRLERDVNDGLRTQDVIARSLSRLALYSQLDTFKINTDTLTAQETAELITSL